MSKPLAPSLEVAVDVAQSHACPDKPIIDIRDERELLAGTLPGARCMSSNELLESVLAGEAAAPRAGYVLCSEGVGSLQLVRQLHDAGMRHFFSVAGGYRAWLDAGLPVLGPGAIDSRQLDRYSRHLVMPQVGPEGQGKLLNARVLLAGLGGLNSPAALYLAAAGVGTIGLADPDHVERSNLQRQVLHGESSVGKEKTASAQERIRDLNPDVETVSLSRRIDPDNAPALVRDWDIVVDGTDNFPVRYALNAACIQHEKPLVYGAVMRFQGQVSVFWPSRAADQPCFRCLMPEQPAASDTPSCSEAGVLGVLPGIVGTLQAAEALKIVLGIGQLLTGRILLFDALTMEFREMRLNKRPGCPACGA